MATTPLVLHVRTLLAPVLLASFSGAAFSCEREPVISLMQELTRVKQAERDDASRDDFSPNRTKIEYFAIASAPDDLAAVQKLIVKYNKRAPPDSEKGRYRTFVRIFIRETCSTPRDYIETEGEDELSDHWHDHLCKLIWNSKGEVKWDWYPYWKDKGAVIPEPVEIPPVKIEVETRILALDHHAREMRAKLLINDSPVGDTPYKTRLKAGVHALRVVDTKLGEASKTVTIRSADDNRFIVRYGIDDTVRPARPMDCAALAQSQYLTDDQVHVSARVYPTSDNQIEVEAFIIPYRPIRLRDQPKLLVGKLDFSSLGADGSLRIKALMTKYELELEVPATCKEEQLKLHLASEPASAAAGLNSGAEIELEVVSPP